MIQDWILAVGALAFLDALRPSLRSDDKPATATSLYTAVILTVYVPTQLSLELYVNAACTSALTVGWYVLAWQKWKADRRQSPPGTRDQVIFP